MRNGMMKGPCENYRKAPLYSAMGGLTPFSNGFTVVQPGLFGIKFFAAACLDFAPKGNSTY